MSTASRSSRPSSSSRISFVHGSAPRIARSRVRRPRINASFLERVSEREQVCRRTQHHLGCEVLDHLGLPRGLPAGCRHDGRAEHLDPGVCTEPSGEQAVAVGVVHHHPGAHSCCPERSGHQVRPRCRGRLRCSRPRWVDPVVPDEAWIRAIRSMGTANMPKGWVSLRSSFVVNGSRRMSSRLRTFFGRDAGGVQARPIRGDVVIRVADDMTQPLEVAVPRAKSRPILSARWQAARAAVPTEPCRLHDRCRCPRPSLTKPHARQATHPHWRAPLPGPSH